MDLLSDTPISSFSLSLRAKRHAVIGLLGLYILSFPVFYDLIDHFYFILGVVPIIAAGLLLGLRGAIYTVMAVSVVQFGVEWGALGYPLEKAVVDSLPIITLLIGGTVGYLVDLRSELNRERKELERRNNQLDEFASIVSHDLRNPLNVAEGRLELAQDECDSPHLDDVARAHDRMEALTDDLLGLARKGKSVESLENVDISDTVKYCWQNVATPQATLNINSEQTIRADPARLKQLLENLFRNGVEHAGKEVRFTVGDLDEGFYIADDGPGIPKPEREQVFDFGYSTAIQGTGFGLSIVKEIVEAHGWRIDVTESDAGGARFDIYGVEIVDE